MMAELLDGQFELGGTRWGDRTPLIIEDGEMPMADVRNEDALNALDHGAVPGRDRLGQSSWSWELASDVEDGAAALEVYDDLATQWRRGLDMAPGELMELRYRTAGRTRRVYGRPRRYDPPKPNLLTQLGQARGAIDFALLDPFTYDDELQSLTIGQLAPVADGTILPATIPFIVGTMPGVQHGAFAVEGKAPTPFTVTFRGPVVNPSISGEGFSIALDTTLAVGQEVTVDTRDGTIRQGATSARGLLRRGSRLKARLTPGSQVLAYRGTDETNTSTITVSWRPAYYSV